MSQPIEQAFAKAKAAYEKLRDACWKLESASTQIAFIADESKLTKQHALAVKRADDAVEAAYAESQKADVCVKRLLNLSSTMWRLFPDEMKRVNAELAELAAPGCQLAA